MTPSLSNSRNQLFLFFLILVVSFSARLITLGSYETWSDEKLSVNEANGFINYPFQNGIAFTNHDLKKHNTFSNVIQSTIQGDGGNGILYILSLHCWNSIFGNSDFAVRFFSVLCGIGVVVLTYRLTLQLFGNTEMALISMLLTGVHPHLISYSQEARTYSFTLLLTLAASLLLLKIVKERTLKNKLLLPYSLLLAAGFLSHYSSVYIFITHFFILLFFFSINVKNAIHLFTFLLLSTAIVLLWFYSYGLEGLRIIADRNQNYIQLSLKDPTNTFYMKTGIYAVAAGWFQNILMFFGNTFVNLGLRIVFLLPLLLIPFFLIFFGLRKRPVAQLRELKILSILAFSSLIYATILALTAGHIISFQQMYSTFSVPYVIIVLSYCIFQIIHAERNIRRFALKAIIGLQLVIMLFSTGLIYFGVDSNTKKANPFELLALEIAAIHSSQNNDFTIMYNHVNTAMELNKRLPSSLKDVPQIVDTTCLSPVLYLKFRESQKQHVLMK